jgi:hypothetical protein
MGKEKKRETRNGNDIGPELLKLRNPVFVKRTFFV